MLNFWGVRAIQPNVYVVTGSEMSRDVADTADTWSDTSNHNLQVAKIVAGPQIVPQILSKSRLSYNYMCYMCYTQTFESNEAANKNWDVGSDSNTPCHDGHFSPDSQQHKISRVAGIIRQMISQKHGVNVKHEMILLMVLKSC